nr:PREDICTED: cuticle protein 16.5-like [Bemisia tabaci]
MKVFAVLACLIAAAAAGAPYASYLGPSTLVRAPQFDSAVVSHERLGGNFAYKSVEAPAYAQVAPVITNVPTPVGVSYSAKPIIAPVTYTSPAEVKVITAPVAVAHAPAPVAYAAPAYAAPAYAAPAIAAPAIAAPAPLAYAARAAIPYAAPYPYAKAYYH